MYEETPTTTHSAEIHQEGTRLLKQLQNLTDVLKKDLKLPDTMKKDLIEALQNSHNSDDHNDDKVPKATESHAKADDGAWRNATLKSSSSAISSTPTIDSAHTLTQPSMIASYESISIDNTNEGIQTDTRQKTTSNNPTLDDLASRLDQHKFNENNIITTPDKDRQPPEVNNEYKSVINKGILRQSRLAPLNIHQHTDEAIIKSTIDMITAKTSNKTRETRTDPTSNIIRNKYKKDDFHLHASPSETSEDEGTDSAVLTATLDHAALTANTGTSSPKPRNYTLKDVENLLADRPIGTITKDPIIDSRPDTPTSVSECEPLPPLRSTLPLDLKTSKEHTVEHQQRSPGPDHQNLGAKRKSNTPRANVRQISQQRETTGTPKIQVSLNEQELHLQGTWKPHFRKFINRLRVEGEYRTFDDTTYFMSDDPFEDVMKLTQTEQQQHLRTRTPSSSTSQGTRTSSFDAYQENKQDRNQILVPTKYNEDSDDRAAKKGLMKRVKDTIFKKHKPTKADKTDQATLSTITIQNEGIFFDVNDDIQNDSDNSDYETESDTDTDATMYHTQTDGNSEYWDHHEQVATDGNQDHWEHHKSVMERVNGDDATNDTYADAHETYIERAEGVMDKLTSLTDLLQLESEENDTTQMAPGHTLHHMQTDFNVLNLIDPMEQTYQPDEQPLQAHFFAMTSTQIRNLKQKTHPTRLAKFNSAADNLNTVKNQLLNFSLQISTISDKARRSRHLQEKINEVALAVQQLKTEETKLEELLKTLSTANHNNHQIPLPSAFGNIDKLRLNDFNNLTKFMPNSKNKLSHVWKSMLERGKLIGKRSKTNEDDDCLSEEAWKDALSQHLLGEALEYYYHYNHLPLTLLLEKLHHRFERIPSRWELHQEVDSFKKDPKDSLSCTIEKLRLMLSKLYADKPPTEREILVHRTIREKIINNNWLPKDIIRNILREEDDARATCQTYDFETRAKDMDYWSKQTEGDLYHKHDELEAGLHAMATKRPESDLLNKTYGGRVEKPQVSRPTSRPNTPPTTQLPTGGLRHGREGQPGYIINNPHGKGPTFSTRKAPYKQNNNRREHLRPNTYNSYNNATRNSTKQDAEPMAQDEARDTTRSNFAHTYQQPNNYERRNTYQQPQERQNNYNQSNSNYDHQQNQNRPYRRENSGSYRQSQAYRENNYRQNQNSGRQNSNNYYPANSTRDKVFRQETEFSSNPAVVISARFTIDEACKKNICRNKYIHAYTNCPNNQQGRDFQERR